MAQAYAKDEVINENALKHLFGQGLLERVSSAVLAVYPQFDRKHFLSLMKHLKELEMKPRVKLLREELHALLPKDYPKALKILLKSAKNEKLKDFDLWPYAEFIQTYGLNDRAISLNALAEITPDFTAEWAIRPFIVQDSKAVIAFLLKCAVSKDVNLRRWASEGTRPRLPWGIRLQAWVKDPKPTLPILEKLKFDEELYVRKSVANHLNDIAKDHPAYVIQTLRRWQKIAGKKHEAKIDWIIKHALRTLIKKGNESALKLIGVSSNAKIKVTDLKFDRSHYRVGDVLKLEFSIRSLAQQSQKLVIDYVVHFARANGKSSAKVFKLKNLALNADESVTIQKNHSLKEVTTRKHYSGKHTIEIQVNGKRYLQSYFTLDT